MNLGLSAPNQTPLALLEHFHAKRLSWLAGKPRYDDARHATPNGRRRTG